MRISSLFGSQEQGPPQQRKGFWSGASPPAAEGAELRFAKERKKACSTRTQQPHPPRFLFCRNPHLPSSCLSTPPGRGPQRLSIPWSGIRASNQFKMPPIGDDTVQTLQDLVNKLESRVKQLEDKLTHAQSGTKHTPAEGVRMILMGPPGAGVSPRSSPPSSCKRRRGTG